MNNFSFSTITPNEKKALWWITPPVVVLAVSYLGTLLIKDSESNWYLIFAVIAFASALVSLIMVMIALNRLFNRQDKAQRIIEAQNKPEYKNLTPEQIKFIQKSFWTPFFNPLAWAFGNRLYPQAIESIIPVWNIIIWLRLMSYGGMISWEQGNWKSFEEFKQRQKNMAWIVLIIIIVGGLIDYSQLTIGVVLLVISYYKIYGKKKAPVSVN